MLFYGARAAKSVGVVAYQNILEWLPIRSNKFNPGFFHNEIRERSQLATKFVTKNGPESH